MGQTICKIKNISGEILGLHTKEFQIDEIHIIRWEERQTWMNNDEVIEAIENQNFEIHNEFGKIEGIENQLSWLREEIIQINNFSYKKIYNGKTILIPEDQQMIVFENINDEANGDLQIDGELVIIKG